jgi:cysteinyl-tRNA synthetase, unknown class
MATYEKGDRNADEVALFQAPIGVGANGKFDAATVNAVKAWQAAHGQKADGKVGPDMILALGLNNLLIVENGDEGDLVRAIQGIVGVATSGDYDDDTEAAVKAWQAQASLKATGSADVRTLDRMGLLRGPDAAAPARQAAIAPRAGAPQVPSMPIATGAAGRPAINSWAYQLAEIDPNVIAGLDVDLAVIDYSADGDDRTAFSGDDVRQMKARPNGRQKLLVSYMSIGEAENYRYYWQAGWSKPATRPAWLDAENKDWEGNFKVRYWDPQWQAIIFGSATSYLDRILGAGFDGVYLDIIDAFEYWRDDKGERATADRDMIQFVTAIAAYARARRPGFLIIPQNGEVLLEDASYRSVISAQAKEDIFFGADGDGRQNKKRAVADCLDHLAYATRDGIPIIAIEYLDDSVQIADASSRLASAGCCATFGPRALDKITLPNVRS